MFCCIGNRRLGNVEPIRSLQEINDVKAATQEVRAGSANLALRETPSEALISALQDRDLKVEISEAKSYSFDLSWLSPTNLTDREQTAKARTRQGKRDPKRPARLSYATIVANYIRYVDPLLSTETLVLGIKSQGLHPLDESLLSVFDDKSMDYLSQRGYSVGDVMTWAWILLCSDPFKAAIRLATLKQHNVGDEKRARIRIPLFVLLFTLRRKHIDSKALRLLLIQSWDILLDLQPNEPPLQTQEKKQPAACFAQPAWMRSGDDASMMILFVRLVRAARVVSPEALLSISSMFTAVFGYDAVASTLKEKQVRRLIVYYNKLLSLLAVPCRLEPFASTVIQQRAIFHLLREMTKFDPPLAVTREGYHAVTRIQAARRKLPAERQWAEFKAKSWPPWKEDKLGIDVDRGLEGSKSKTIGSITHMKEAGYSPTRWDRIATIVAGWDIDGTPTIQTRTFLPKPNAYRMGDQLTVWLAVNNGDGFLDYGHEDTYSDIWAARIRATRTMKEAWACFLSCRDQGLRITNDIYYELIEKVIYHEYLQDSSRPPSTGVLPGDGKEVYPEPSSPRDVIYVHSEPPTLDTMLRHMFSQKIKLSRRLLVLLLTHSTSFNSGLQFLAYSSLPRRQVEALTSVLGHTDPSRKLHLDRIPNDIFAAFIRFLCRFSHHGGSRQMSSTIALNHFFPIAVPVSTLDREFDDLEGKIAIDQSFTHAISLVRLRMPEYLPTWHHLLTSLACTRLPAGNPYLPLSAQRVLAWAEVREVALWMERKSLNLDDSCFYSMCEALSRLLLTIRKGEHGIGLGMELLQRTESNVGHLLPCSQFTISEMATDGVNFLKWKFDQMVLSRDGPLFPLASGRTIASPNHPVLPKMFAIPNPSTLHGFIRVLGLAADFESLIPLLTWMTRNASDLRRVTEESFGGERSMRWAVVAIRVYLEKNALRREPASFSVSAALNGQPPDLDVPAHPSEVLKEELVPSQSSLYLQEAYDIIESSQLLSPWPTDYEVREYIAEHKGLF
ncbi:hypothetical protein PRK78_000580 [Emydomyces testavorans]|uniref:Uncharacterized protein n=1 Tax=Emydomyces testavorans TaxID=2070801 RepID=A0AAF0IFS3_9EURO|nr:hypothetical protein PRK78_000580 [Emydomyces testavorans]